jgi:superfamily I DNA/RNA helicase
MMRKILGPPGTGKTTRLLHYARTFLKLGTPIDKIGYFAFTKKAAGEARERMLDQNPHISEKELKHFRTLHSLAFWKLGMKKSQVMQDEHYEDIGRNLGIEVTVYSNGQETTGLLKKNSKHVILAGDDDQAIYGWAGADVKRFQQEPAKEIVLPQSYRVPRLVQHIADNILSRIPDERRLKKKWKARDEDGSTHYITSIEDVPLHEGKWLVLARYNDKLIKLKPSLRDRGIYFEYKKRKSYKTRLYTAIENYKRWTKGSQLSISECRDLFEFFGKEFPEKEERLYDLKEFGYSHTQRWFEVFETEPEDSLYIRNMMEAGEELSKEARVKLSTIHSAKGGEADNVLLIMDNTKTIREATEKSLDKEDEEHRVWYVGVTRTKQNLYILAAKKEDKGYDIESIQ